MQQRHRLNRHDTCVDFASQFVYINAIRWKDSAWLTLKVLSKSDRYETRPCEETPRYKLLRKQNGEDSFWKSVIVY